MRTLSDTNFFAPCQHRSCMKKKKRFSTSPEQKSGTRATAQPWKNLSKALNSYNNLQKCWKEFLVLAFFFVVVWTFWYMWWSEYYIQIFMFMWREIYYYNKVKSLHKKESLEKNGIQHITIKWVSLIHWSCLKGCSKFESDMQA